MKYLLILLLFPTSLSAQTYILRKIQLGNPNDSLYMKEGSPDSLWRRNGGTTYSFAFVMAERNYYPAFQLSGTAVQLPVDWNIVTNRPTIPTNTNQLTNGAGFITNSETASTYFTIASAAGKQNTITVLPFANGGISGAAATSATTGTMTVNMTSSVITITPTGACTFNASGGVAGQIVTFSITTSGTTSRVLTWGTNFRKTGTLATGTVSARFFTVTFRCLDGVIWQEISRTVVQT